MNIAIDGPSGAGKSTVARLLAERLGMVYLDTGAMYRAVALGAHEQGIPPQEGLRLNAYLAAVALDVRYEHGEQKIFLNGQDVSTRIREHYVSKLASDYSALQSVRTKMVALQREIAAKTDTVLDGRDIGSAVLPNAEFKFYLDASVDVRATRRYRELQQRGQSSSWETIRDDIAARDYNDMHRTFSPLVRAADAVYIDSSEMTVEQVVTYIRSAMEERR